MEEIMWQIVVILDMMHSVHRCCHLSLTMSKIMVSGATFVTNSDDTMNIQRGIKVKVLLASSTTYFSNGRFGFDQKGKRFDARAIDLVSAGHILYQCMVGVGASLADLDDISMVREIVQNGFWMFERDGHELYLSEYNMFRLQKCHSFWFLKQLLSLNTSSWAVMHHAFLWEYFERDAVLLDKAYQHALQLDIVGTQLKGFIAFKE